MRRGRLSCGADCLPPRPAAVPVAWGRIAAASPPHRRRIATQAVRAENPEMLYYCDPVMGDNGRLGLG